MSFNVHAAIDLGASSGRVVLGYLEGGKIQLKEVHRFDNIQKKIEGHDCWDIDSLFENILIGLSKCRDIKQPDTIAIDTWAVDFVLLDKHKNLIGNCVAYRDSRTEGIYPVVDAMIPFERAYKITGIQRQPFNTLYQLVALSKQNPEQLDCAEHFLMVPDYLNFKLCGVIANEYTNASSTAMLDAKLCTWSEEIIDKCKLPRHIFKDLAQPGTLLGELSSDIANKIGYNAKVIACATHDTGSAYISVPVTNDTSVFLSSGTWSLMGVENKEPITSDEARHFNFTNEGGIEHTYRFLRNIMGLWLIQSVRRELNGVSYVEDGDDKSGDVGDCVNVDACGVSSFVKSLQKGNGQTYEFSELADLAKSEASFFSVIDVNDNRFLSPKCMIEEIRSACKEIGQKVPSNVGQLMQCIYLSLAKCYKDAILGLEKINGKKYTDLNIVGGGCQDNYLNSITAKTCNINVHAGPIEATCIGNIVAQMIYSKEIDNIASARSLIQKSFVLKNFK